MNHKTIIIVTICVIATSFSGCVVGSIVAAPFKVSGAVLNIVTPDVVGDSVGATGDVLNTAIPF